MILCVPIAQFPGRQNRFYSTQFIMSKIACYRSYQKASFSKYRIITLQFGIFFSSLLFEYQMLLNDFSFTNLARERRGTSRWDMIHPRKLLISEI